MAALLILLGAVSVVGLEAVLALLCLRLHLLPLWVLALGLFAMAGLWAFVGNFSMAGVFCIGSTCDSNIPHWGIVDSFLLVTAASFWATGGLLVLIRRPVIVAVLIHCLMAGLYTSLAVTYQVNYSVYAHDPLDGSFLVPGRAATLSTEVFVPCTVLLGILGSAMILGRRDGRT